VWAKIPSRGPSGACVRCQTLTNITYEPQGSSVFHGTTARPMMICIVLLNPHRAAPRYPYVLSRSESLSKIKGCLTHRTSESLGEWFELWTVQTSGMSLSLRLYHSCWSASSPASVFVLVSTRFELPRVSLVTPPILLFPLPRHRRYCPRTPNHPRRLLFHLACLCSVHLPGSTLFS
jgi:hypothetical protein